jgi:hypothetical protein
MNSPAADRRDQRREFSMLGRFAAVSAGLLLALSAWIASHAESTGDEPVARSAPRRTAAPGTVYAVEPTGPTTAIELPAEFADQCDLIVSNLGRNDSLVRLRLSAQSAAANAPGLLREVPEFHWRLRPKPKIADDIDETAPEAGLSTSRIRRAFHLHVADMPLEDPRGYTRVAATLLGEGRLVSVYGDDQLRPGEIADGLVDEIIERLDGRIIPRSRALLGAHRDIDGDGRLAILLTPWLGKLQGGRTSVNGFVRSGDFQPRTPIPFGNRADVLYLNSAVRPGSELAALLAHEYTHAVCCSLRLAGPSRAAPFPDEPDWLNEAIAHVAEVLHGAGWSNLEDRVGSFLDCPAQSPLVVRDYYRAGRWRDPGCRGATFLFLQWCVDGAGEGLLRDLVADPRTGIEKLEALTGQPFPVLYRQWTIALHQGRIGTIDLHGRLGKRSLAGVQTIDWDRTAHPCDLELCGTASAFVHCRAGSSTRNRRMLITAEPGARLQVTIVRSDPDRVIPSAPLQVTHRP